LKVERKKRHTQNNVQNKRIQFLNQDYDLKIGPYKKSLIMKEKMFPKPSFLAHMFHAFLLLFAVIYGIQHYRSLRVLDPYRISVLLLLFSIVVGIHALSHLGLETISREEFVNGRFTCPCQMGICPGRRSGACPWAHGAFIQ
jgi:hypothetical protein